MAKAESTSPGSDEKQDHKHFYLEDPQKGSHWEGSVPGQSSERETEKEPLAAPSSPFPFAKSANNQ